MSTRGDQPPWVVEADTTDERELQLRRFYARFDWPSMDEEGRSDLLRHWEDDNIDWKSLSGQEEWEIRRRSGFCGRIIGTAQSITVHRPVGTQVNPPS